MRQLETGRNLSEEWRVWITEDWRRQEHRSTAFAHERRKQMSTNRARSLQNAPRDTLGR